MLRAHPLVSGEVYHLYNRGAHKEPVFIDERDYRRFLLLLYIANNSESVHLGNLLQKHKGRSFTDMFSEVDSDKALVDIFAHSLMPNHFHLVVRQKSETGITSFMKKVATAYSMYFNTKYDHSGVVFQGRFKSKNINNEPYFRYIFAYTHLNPVELIAPNWENGVTEKKISEIEKYMNEYPYSSHYDYCVGSRPERKILSYDEAPSFLKIDNDVKDLLKLLRSQTFRTVLDVGGDKGSEE